MLGDEKLSCWGLCQDTSTIVLNKTFSVSVRDDQSEPGKDEVTNLVHTQQVKLATNQGKKITLQKSHQS